MNQPDRDELIVQPAVKYVVDARDDVVVEVLLV